MRFIHAFIRNFTRVTALALTVILLCSCGDDGNGIIIPPSSSGSTDDTQEAEAGGTLRIPMTLSPYSMHPLYIKEAQMRNIYSMIFEPLIEFDDNMEPCACIAESWKYEGDSWVIKLRSNVHWHGTLGEISAADAAYTINAILSDPESIYYSNLSAYAVSAEGYDTTLTVHTRTPSYAAIYALNIPVIPEKYYSGKSKTCRDIPLGSGCYAVDSLTFDGETRMQLSAFSRWWKKLPYISAVTAVGYKDSESIFGAFTSGELDCVPTSLKTTEIYEILDGVNEKSYLSHNYVFLAFNMARPIMQNADFRHALAYAVNRTKIINNVYLSKASGAEQPLFNDSSLSSAAVTRYDHNATRAREIIDSLYYTDDDLDGFVEANGAKITLTIAVRNVPENPVRLEAAESIKADLAEVGIDVEIHSLSESELQAAVQKREYDIILSGYYLSDTPNLRFAFLGDGNLSSYSSAALNSALDGIDAAESPQKLKSAVLTLQQVLADELPHIGLFFEMNTFLYGEKLHIGKIQRESNVYSTINTWWIENEK